MRYVAIIAQAVCAAIVYGVLHNQITARICLEYFTVGHPPVFKTQDPTWLAAGWGVIATWWVGVLIGVPLAVAAQAGSWPRRDPLSLVRPLLILMLVMAACAGLGGILGYNLGAARAVFLLEPLASRIPPELHPRYLACLWMHGASYLIGFLGGLALIAWITLNRFMIARKSNSAQIASPTPGT